MNNINSLTLNAFIIMSNCYGTNIRINFYIAESFWKNLNNFGKFIDFLMRRKK